MIRSALRIMHRFGLNAGSSGRRAAITVALALAAASLAGTAQASVLTAGAPSAVAAATACKTISYDASVNNNVGLRLESFTVSTYFCYNGVQVTYHDTYPIINISGVGSAGGWSYLGLITNDFHCEVTDGSKNKCGKNVEVLQGHFQACFSKVGCV